MALGQYSGGIGAIAGGIIGGVIGSIYGQTYPGAMLGASIGGMAGGIAGQVFWPDKTDINHPPPPAPHENRLQVSTYGAPIPIVYESARLAGNIIYMSDVVEDVNRSKHRNEGVRYYEMVKTYTATFAIAFCEGPVSGISRIWVNEEVFADFRDPDGEYYPTGSTALAQANLATSVARAATWFSIYTGTETQTADPTLVGLLTAAETPSYRGICYIVFIDFPVGEFTGIPKIEVEIGEPAAIEFSFTGGAEADDGWIWSIDGITLRTDNIVTGVDSFGTNKAFVRVDNVALPNGATVSTANLIIKPTGSYGRDIALEIKVELADDPATIANGTDYNSRSWSSGVAWTISDEASAETSSNIASLINQVLSRPGWVSGNAMVFTIVPAGSVTPTDYFSWYGYGAPMGSPTLYAAY